jgi:hypothetical protein
MTPYQRATRNRVIEVANAMRAKHGLPHYNKPSHSNEKAGRDLPALSHNTAGLWYDEMRGVWRPVRKGD